MTRTTDTAHDWIVPGARFSTPHESGCTVLTAPDAAGSFRALDSDGVECSYEVPSRAASMPLTEEPA